MECEENDTITVVTSGDIEFKIPKKHFLSKMVMDVINDDMVDEGPIPLLYVIPSNVNLFKICLEKIYSLKEDKITEDERKKTTEDIEKELDTQYNLCAILCGIWI